jgi:hypothetical protein
MGPPVPLRFLTNILQALELVLFFIYRHEFRSLCIMWKLQMNPELRKQRLTGRVIITMALAIQNSELKQSS